MKITKTIRIGTRASKLALWQSQFVADELKKKYPDLKFELVKIQTTGDKVLDVMLSKLGGKGVFIKEIEVALLKNKIDLAVHSLKDVPNELGVEYKIAAVTKRADPFDAFVSNKFFSLAELPQGAVVGTSSLRRAAQILNLYPHLRIENLRGNVDTRLKKLDAGNFDAIILAAAGLERLGYSGRIKQILTEIIPAAGQGALAIEIRADDIEVAETVNFLNDEKTFQATKIERDFLKVIGGSCQIPVGIFAEVYENKISARAVIASLDGKKIVKDSSTAPIENISTFGKALAEKFLANGGREILRELVI